MANTMDEASPQEGLAQQAQSTVQEATATAQEKASELREHGSQRLREQVDQRSTEVGQQMRSLAEQLRRSGNELRQSDGNSNAAQLTGQAADRLERLGSYLEQVSGDDVMRDIESFARRRPWMLAGAGLIAGVAAARFMKASSEQRYEGGRVSQGQVGYSTGREIAGPRDGYVEAQSASGSR
jgi:ElaB/YqjD/DUF883 family membrane-anchored ribosome-binding protein